MSQRVVGACVAAVVALSMHAWVMAQAPLPHGGNTTKPQPGPNVNAVGGIVDLSDPSALVKVDLNEQRQNETVLAASMRNPDHILAAANDYRFVDFPDDPGFGGGQNFIARLVARLMFWRDAREEREEKLERAASKGAWTGVYRSCDRGRTWIGSALPGGPLDESDASKQSPLKALSDAAEAVGAHAETTDPVLVAGGAGRMHLVVLGFVRFSNGAVGESRMYYASYTDRNNREGGTCFNYDFTRQIDIATNYIAPGAPTPFIDKPSLAVDPDGTIYAAYTVFLDSVRSKIVIARSTDGGITWTRTIPLLNAGFLRNHGTTIALDPQSGQLWVAWRMFYDNWPLMVISRSLDKGRTFLPATPISHWWPTLSLAQIVAQLKAAKLQPFDQFTSEPGAPATGRALAFPTLMSGVVNGKTMLYAAWTERVSLTLGPNFGQPDPNGSPRIVFMMSSNGGINWTPRKAIDAGTRTENLQQQGVGPMTTRNSAPQVQPVLTMSGLSNPQLLLLYYETRGELNQPFATNFISGIERRMDVRVARIDPALGTLLAPSVQVSQYRIQTNSSPAVLAEMAPGVAATNLENVTVYSGGLAAFFGDYPGASPARPFEYLNGRWRWANDPSPTMTMWTDTRDLEPPLDATGKSSLYGDWTKYTALVPTVPSPYPPNCGHVASRNVNPYFAEIGGLIVGTGQTFKPLLIQRAFATYAENRTPNDMFVRMTVLDNEPIGLNGSFDQFDFSGEANDTIDMKIFANSGQHRTVWVQPFLANPTASVQILVREITGIGGSVKTNGFGGRIVLNPDPGNNPLLSVPPGVPGFDGVTANDSELHNPQISTPQIATFRIAAPGQSAPQIATPQIATPQIATPQIATPQNSTPQISTPQISTPSVPGGEENGTDVSYVVTNQGTTDSTYDGLFNVPNVAELMQSGNYQFQVLLTRTSLTPGHFFQNGRCEPVAKTETQVLNNIPVPQISTPQIATIQNPQIATPQISTPQIATFSIGPYNGAEGQNSHGDDGNEDDHSHVLPDQVILTLRAIRLKPLAAGGPLFNPNTVVVRVQAASTNVVFGVVDADGSQPSTFTQPNLVVDDYVPASPALTAAAGGQVTVSAFSMRNAGNASTSGGIINIGYYLSTDAVITASDTLLDSTSVEGTFTPGDTFDFDERTLTIPSSVEPGSYYIGVLVDRSGFVVEGNEQDNDISEPITITEGDLCLAPPANMMSWWPLDGAVDDLIGNNAGFESGISATFEPGKVGNALTLTGTGFARVYEDADTPMKPANLTLDFWFKPTGTLNSDSPPTPLVVKLDPVEFEGDTGDNYGTVSRGFDIVYLSGALRFGLRRSDGVRVNVSYAVTIPAGTWTHVAGTFDGTVQRLYVNGVQVGSHNWATAGETFSYDPGSTAVVFGQFLCCDIELPALYTFHGQIDEVELFERALSVEEIGALYDADSNGKCKVAPEDILVLDSNSETESYNILRFTPTGEFVNRIPMTTNFGCVQGFAVEPSTGDIFVSDQCQNRIVRMTRAGLQTDFYSEEYPSSFSPARITFDASGNVIVVDTGDTPTVNRITPEGVRTVLFTITETSAFDIDLRIDTAGNVITTYTYVENVEPFTQHAVIRRTEPDWVTTTVVVDSVSIRITGLAIDSGGNYIVADQLGARLARVTPAGVITTISSDLCCSIYGVAITASGRLITRLNVDQEWLISVDPVTGEYETEPPLHEGEPLNNPRYIVIYRHD